jgi:hypothetical protein
MGTPTGNAHTEEAGHEPGARDWMSLCCADVHPVLCNAKWVSPNANELVENAVAHGEAAHGFTPAYYSPDRIATICRAARPAPPLGSYGGTVVKG